MTEQHAKYFTYGTLTALGLIAFVLVMYFGKAKEHTDIIRYQVVSIAEYKTVDGRHVATYYNVRINGHDYIKMESEFHNNVIFYHSPKCKYCKKRNIISHNHEVFTTGDGNTSDMKEKFLKKKGTK